MHTTLIVMAKAPQPGQAKTRLIPSLGVTEAATIARRLFDHTMTHIAASSVHRIHLRLTPPPHDPAWEGIDLPTGSDTADQGSGDLGKRMLAAVTECLRTSDAAILIGTDCPALTTPTINTLCEKLNEPTIDTVLIPAHDGGYVALGVTTVDPEIFSDMPWSTDQVAQITLARLESLGRKVAVLPALPDIDTPEDLRHLPWT